MLVRKLVLPGNNVAAKATCTSILPKSSTTLVPYCQRGIYFIKPDREVEMIDFALNIGYNDLYEAYCGQYLNW